MGLTHYSNTPMFMKEVHLLKSMTGFGRGEAVLNGRRFIAEIKTVNNRHRDLFVRCALIRIETWILRGAKEEERKMVLTDARDLDWARRVGDGTNKPASEPHGDNRNRRHIRGDFVAAGNLQR